MHQLRETLQQHFLLRWTLVNLVGWSVGLLLGAWTLRSPLICLNGGLAAACIGLAQWLVLRQDYAIARKWIMYSVIGGALGIIPAFFLVITIIFGGLESFATLTGMVFGIGIGGMQWLMLRVYPHSEWWIPACGLGGGLGGLLSVTTIINGLPLGLLLGAALFGLITGYALKRILYQTE
jgi:hypothetical protein